MSADIKKMYRQIDVTEEHRSLQRILWRWNKEELPRVFNLNTVTYGMASSPYLAIRCLKEIALLAAQDYSCGSKTILNDFYVDDLFTGTDTKN